MRRALIRPLITGLLLLQPLYAWAEGAVRVLACTIDLACDAAGACTPAGGEVVFTMAPEQVADDGSGTYRISYGDEAAAMEARSFAGPFLWTLGDESHTLLANSETRFLWHRLALDAGPEADVIFMVCEFTQ